MQKAQVIFPISYPLQPVILRNRKIHRFVLTAYDDLEKDGPFATQNYRLTGGKLINPQSDSSAVINETFATINGISIGDRIRLENEHGKPFPQPSVACFFPE